MNNSSSCASIHPSAWMSGMFLENMRCLIVCGGMGSIPCWIFYDKASQDLWSTCSALSKRSLRFWNGWFCRIQSLGTRCSNNWAMWLDMVCLRRSWIGNIGTLYRGVGTKRLRTEIPIADESNIILGSCHNLIRFRHSFSLPKLSSVCSHFQAAGWPLAVSSMTGPIWHFKKTPWPLTLSPHITCYLVATPLSGLWPLQMVSCRSYHRTWNTTVTKDNTQCTSCPAISPLYLVTTILHSWLWDLPKARVDVLARQMNWVQPTRSKHV